MSRSVRALALGLALGLCLLAGCAAQQADSGLRVYCLESLAEGNERLVYDRLDMPEELGREERCALVMDAVARPSSDRYLSALPQDIGWGLTLQGTAVSVDFDPAFDSLSNTRKSLAVAALALSLLELPDISYVYISAGRKAQPPFYGQPITRDSFITEEDGLRYFG